jgi:hypothetical protein
MGVITAPHQVARGGYMTWWEPRSKHLSQVSYRNERREYRDLGEYADIKRAVANANTRRAPIGFFGRPDEDL